MGVSDYGWSGGGGGSNYTFSSTPTGQGNWNTGGDRTGSGSMDRGIVGIGGNPRYTVAPTGGPRSPNYQGFVNRLLTAMGRNITPAASGTGAVSQIPIPRPNPFATFTGPPISPTWDPGVYPPSTPAPVPTKQFYDRLPANPSAKEFDTWGRIAPERGVMNGGFSGGGFGGGGGGGW